jgi:hypothetical protein
LFAFVGFPVSVLYLCFHFGVFVDFPVSVLYLCFHFGVFVGLLPFCLVLLVKRVLVALAIIFSN